MKVIYFNLEQTVVSLPFLSACIGYFDGLHRGHQALVRNAISQASQLKIASALITFDPDPICIIRKLNNKPHLMTLDEKIQKAEQLGLDYFIVCKMSEELVKTSPADFVLKVIKPLNIKHITCGFDFHFGYKGAGDGQLLTELGKDLFGIDVIEAITFEDKKISSTRIIEALNNADMPLVTRLLGDYYCLTGSVIDGNKQGRKVGFPTANLAVGNDKIIPKTGVYAVLVELDGKVYKGITNIGFNPTYNTSSTVKIETYIIDFKQAIYGSQMKLLLVEYLREELKFDTIDELTVQMQVDTINAQEVLANVRI